TATLRARATGGHFPMWRCSRCARLVPPGKTPKAIAWSPAGTGGRAFPAVCPIATLSARSSLRKRRSPMRVRWHYERLPQGLRAHDVDRPDREPTHGPAHPVLSPDVREGLG